MLPTFKELCERGEYLGGGASGNCWHDDYLYKGVAYCVSGTTSIDDGNTVKEKQND